MHVDYFDAEVIDIIDESPIVKRYYFKMPDTMEFRFQAGQFVMLDLPIESKFTNRSYSIASPPTHDNMFELCIVLKEDGVGTPHLWKNVHVGSKVKTAGPFGKFVLSPTHPGDICFLATGTGIAPLRSMLLRIIQEQIPHQDIYMIFGNRLEQDILYRKEMEEIQSLHPRFHFIPVLSRQSEWNGKKGYVHDTVREIFGDGHPATFYICGWKNMVREARENLKNMGYTKPDIKFESYD